MTATGARVGSAPPTVLAAIAAAWIVAMIAETTGLGERLHHHELIGGGPPPAVALALFLLAWQVHVAAMMLPSSLPLIALFDRVLAGLPDRRAAWRAFLSGYAMVWTGFGAVAFLADAVLHGAVEEWAWLAGRPSLLGGSVLLAAGAFQFSSLKDRCLRECRHPAGFISRHYRRGRWAALALGTRHGLFCLGCCWALMLLLLAVGVTNLAWMAPLALLMFAEKAGRASDRLVRSAGLALLVLGALVLVTGQELV